MQVTAPTNYATVIINVTVLSNVIIINLSKIIVLLHSDWVQSFRPITSILSSSEMVQQWQTPN